MSRNTISLVVADDQVLFVDLLQSIIENREKELKIVGVAHNGEDAISLVEKERPDIALIDIRMPVLDGVEATKIISSNYPETKVVLLTTFPDDEYVERAVKYGASGYILKNIPVDELIQIIRSIHKGNFIVSDEVAKKLFKTKKKQLKKRLSDFSFTDEQLQMIESLSNREREVYELMIQGYHNDEIADMLFIALQTVKNHIHSIYTKFGIHSRSNLYNMNLDK